MAKTKIMKKTYDVDAGTGALTFTDGQAISFDLSKLPANIVRQAALHGLNQKIGDAAASHGDDPDKAYEACMTTFEQIMSGEWNKGREKGEGTRPSMVVEAVFRAKQKAGMEVDLATIRAKYTGEGTEEARKAALTNPQVKAEYEALKAEAAQERAKKAADAANAGTPADLGAI